MIYEYIAECFGQVLLYNREQDKTAVGYRIGEALIIPLDEGDE